MHVTFGGQQQLQFGMGRRKRQATDAEPAQDADAKEGSQRSLPKSERLTRRPAGAEGFRPVPPVSLVAPKTDNFEYASVGARRLLNISPNSVAVKKRKLDIPVTAIEDAADIGHGSADVQRLLKIRPPSVVVKSRNGQDAGRINTKPCPKDPALRQRWIDELAALHEEHEKWQFRIKAKKAEVDDHDFALDPKEIQRMKAERSKQHAFYYEPFADVVVSNREKLTRGEEIDEEAEEINKQNAITRAEILRRGL